MNIDKLPATLKEVAQALNAQKNVPYELTVTAALGLMGLAVQGRYKIDTQHFDDRSLCSYTMALVPSGCMKSEIFKPLTKGIQAFEDEANESYQFERKKYDSEKERFDRKKKDLLKEKDDVTYGKMLEELLAEEPKAPKRPTLMYENVTSAGLFEVLEGSHHSTALVSPEAGSFLGSHGFTSSDVVQGFLANLNKLWGAEKIERITGSVQQRLHHRMMSMSLMTQKETLINLANNPLFEASGFSARFYITEVKRFTPPRMSMLGDDFQESKRALDRATDAFNAKMRNHLDQGFEYTEEGGTERLKLTTVRLEHDALKDYDAWQLGEGGDIRDGSDHPFFQKYLEHALRLATILATFDGHLSVPMPYWEAGKELAAYYGAQWQNFDSGSVIVANKIVVATEDVVKAVKRKAKLKEGFTWSDIKDLSAIRKLSVDEREKVKIELENHSEIETAIIMSANNREVTQFSLR